jgi:hypothetical protein
MHDVQEHKPTLSDNRFLSKLREEMLEVYPREEDRCRAFRETCEVHGLPLRAASVGPAPYQTNGDLRSHNAMLLVTEGRTSGMA